MKPRWTNKLTWEIAGRNAKGSIILRATNRATFHCKYGKVTILEGDLSDGASVPRWAWAFVSPLDSEFGNAPWPHDKIYSDKNTQFTRRQADLIFNEAMKCETMPFLKRRLVFDAVRIGGWVPWKTKKEHKIVIAHNA